MSVDDSIAHEVKLSDQDVQGAGIRIQTCGLGNAVESVET
jgi:hypothetical protein